MMLAVAMIAFLVLGLWAHTGTMPPLVVVESSSMIHEENGEVCPANWEPGKEGMKESHDGVADYLSRH